jgi:hypothetical protein
MTATAQAERIRQCAGRFPIHGRLGIALVAVFWALNWALQGPRTHWGFFPLWLGYCLTVDGLTRWRTGTSLLTRSWRAYAGLFLLSAPAWWLFEALNLRTQNWLYLGVDGLSSLGFALLTTLSFTTVVPAVLGTTELIASFSFLNRVRPGPVIRPDRPTTTTFFVIGWITLALMLIWPRIFFPFVWISLFCILEPLNIWLGNRSLAYWTRVGDWRPVLALWLGVLCTAFFWEMWNVFSYPKWIYQVPWGDWLHVFEMPLLGYGGYLPFALELYALYNLASGLVGRSSSDYVRIAPTG